MLVDRPNCSLLAEITARLVIQLVLARVYDGRVPGLRHRPTYHYTYKLIKNEYVNDRFSSTKPSTKSREYGDNCYIKETLKRSPNNVFASMRFMFCNLS